MVTQTRQSITKVLLAAVLTATASLVLSSAFLTGVAFLPMPFWDYWEVVLPEQNWAHLLAKHNEHFIVFPRLVFLADSILFHATGLFGIAVD